MDFGSEAEFAQQMLGAELKLIESAIPTFTLFHQTRSAQETQIGFILVELSGGRMTCRAAFFCTMHDAYNTMPSFADPKTDKTILAFYIIVNPLKSIFCIIILTTLVCCIVMIP